MHKKCQQRQKWDAKVKLKKNRRKKCPVINNEDSWWRVGITFIVLCMMAKIIGRRRHKLIQCCDFIKLHKEKWMGGEVSLHKSQKTSTETPFLIINSHNAFKAWKKNRNMKLNRSKGKTFCKKIKSSTMKYACMHVHTKCCVMWASKTRLDSSSILQATTLCRLLWKSTPKRKQKLLSLRKSLQITYTRCCCLKNSWKF